MSLTLFAMACGQGDRDPQEAAQPAADEAERAGGEGDGQSFEEAMRRLCNAPREAGLDEGVEPAQRAAALAQHIDDELENPEVRDLFEALANMDMSVRVDHLEDAAARAGLDECPIVETWGPAPGDEP